VSTDAAVNHIPANVPEVPDLLLFDTASGLQRDLSPEHLYQSACDICYIQIAKKGTTKIGIKSAALQMYYCQFFIDIAPSDKVKPKCWSINLERYLHVYRVRCTDTNDEYISVCPTCQSCLKPRKIPRFSILNNVFPEPIPQCMLDDNQLSLAESIAVAKVFTALYQMSFSNYVGISTFGCIQTEKHQNAEQAFLFERPLCQL
jgi:hypothetical protein